MYVPNNHGCRYQLDDYRRYPRTNVHKLLGRPASRNFVLIEKAGFVRDESGPQQWQSCELKVTFMVGKGRALSVGTELHHPATQRLARHRTDNRPIQRVGALIPFAEPPTLTACPPLARD